MLPFKAKLSPHSKYRVALGIATISLMFVFTGCVRRRLTVRTNPPGAMVYVDHQRIGTTPVSTNYVYYGTREFEIIKDGFKTEKFMRRFNPPWYEFPGLDFVAETLWPYEIRDERIVDVQMSADVNPPTETLIQNGEQLRSQASRGFVVGQPPTLGLAPEQLVIPSSQSPLVANPSNLDLSNPPGSLNSPIPLSPNAGQIAPPPILINPNPASPGYVPPPGTFFDSLPSSIPSTSVTPGPSYRPPTSPDSP